MNAELRSRPALYRRTAAPTTKTPTTPKIIFWLAILDGSLTDLYLAYHPAFHMAWDCACEVERARLVKLPDQAATLAGAKRNRIRFSVLHAWVFSHFHCVSLQIGKRTKYHFMRQFSGILSSEANRLPRADLDFAGYKSDCGVQPTPDILCSCLLKTTTSTEDLLEAIREGAVLRVRPKAMTVAVILGGLLPFICGAAEPAQR